MNKPLPVKITILNKLKASLFTSLQDIQGSLRCENPVINVRCGVVCDVSKDLFIRIPSKEIWLIPSNNFKNQAVVYSNVTWVIS